MAEKIKKHALRALISYAVFLFISMVTSSVFIIAGGGFVHELNISSEPLFAFSSLTLLFSVYSVIRAFELYDLGARRIFVAEIGKKYSLKDDLRISFGHPYMKVKTLVETAVILLLVLILPVGVGYRYLMRAVSSVIPVSGWNVYFLKNAIMGPVALLMTLLARTSAHKWWIVARTTERERLEGMQNPIPRLVIELVKIFVIYLAGFVVLPTLIMLIVSLILTIGLLSSQPWIIPVALVILFVPMIQRNVRALSRRARIYGYIKRRLIKAGYTITDIRYPVISSISPRDGATFNMSRDGETYSVKLISSKVRRFPMFINTEGFVTVKHTVSFMRITLFHLMTDIDYSFGSSEKKIVVLAPSSRRVYINWGRTDTAYDDGDGGTVPTIVTMRAAIMSGGKASRGIHGPGYISDVDRGIIKTFETGDKIGEYKFFTPSGFVSAAENNCLER